MRALVVIGLAGCWTGPAPPPHPPFVCPGTEGTPSDYTTPVIDGIVAAFELCGDMTTNEGVIRVSRGRGTRTLGDNGCVKPPDPSDPTACPVIHPGLVSWIAREELHASGLGVNGTGMSTCSTWVRSNYEFSISTNNWSHAEAFVRRVADVLERYDIAGRSNVHVRQIPCRVLALSSSSRGRRSS